MNKDLEKIEDFYNNIAYRRDFWRKKNSYYHEQITRLFQFLIPENKKVIEIGCSTGDLLASVKPIKGLGMDISGDMIKLARSKYPKLKFMRGYAEHLTINGEYDYVIFSDLIGVLIDIQRALLELHKISGEHTRIIISYYNYAWEPIVSLLERLHIKMPQPIHNWLSKEDVKNLLELSKLEVIKESTFLLIPFPLPFVSSFINKYIARLPLFRNLCFINYCIVRKRPTLSSDKDYSVSVIIPALNESGNIERAITELPVLGKKTEIIFVEGHSRDNTKQEIKRVIKKYGKEKNIQLIQQGKGIGKADAVRKGIAKANGDIILIFDADLTVDPSELPKFYQALRTKQTEYIQGSRLVYPMEKEAMRLLNLFGNKFFSVAFSYLLDQRVKDTLCGTKGLFRKYYDMIALNRRYFGEFDPFGDFDLIFGAAKLHLKIMEIPIRYKARSYGESNISRFLHGWLLLRMVLFAAKKIKFF